MEDPYARIRQLIAEYDAKQRSDTGEANVDGRIDWLALATKEFSHGWLIDQFWPVGSHMHIFASPKTGKSLLGLWLATNIAIGRDPFTWEPMHRRKGLYIDNEMTETDLQERFLDMQFEATDLVDWLSYYFYPNLAPMDTPSGGIETLQLMEEYDAEVLFIDTLSRVVKGEENSNDTYRNFYNHTGRLLKANGKSVLRFDHAGHNPTKSRGASAKADDVDLVFALEKRESSDGIPGFKLTRTHARVSGIMEAIELALNEDPLAIKATHVRTWSDGAIRKARELDSIKAPIDATQRETIRLLKEAGFGPGKTTILMEAIQLRQYRDPINGFLFKGFS